MFLDPECYVEMQFDNSSFRVAAVIHPSTYLNKVLFASHQGALQLWNVHSNKLLYTFSGWGTSITVLEQVTAFSYNSCVWWLLLARRNRKSSIKITTACNLSQKPIISQVSVRIFRF